MVPEVSGRGHGVALRWRGSSPVRIFWGGSDSWQWGLGWLRTWPLRVGSPTVPRIRGCAREGSGPALDSVLGPTGSTQM